MQIVNFYASENLETYSMKYVVIVAKFKDKWIFVRHFERNTWEIPGGHINEDEPIESAAKRELYEETGALEFKLYPICIYSVRDDIKETFGYLYVANINKLGPLPNSEISEIKFVSDLPGNLTYPQIQPFLFHKANTLYKEMAV